MATELTGLSQHMSRGNQEKTRKAPLTAILSFDENWHTRFPEFLPAAPQLQGMYDENAELRMSSGTANAHIQVGYFIIAARAAGRALDKAASRGVIHANQAANRKSAIAAQAAAL